LWNQQIDDHFMIRLEELMAEKRSLKSRVLATLEENKGVNLSGEVLAENLDVSRAAVWKAIKALQSDGYAITAVTNRGYSLALESDVLSEQGILPYLDESLRPAPQNHDSVYIKVFQTVESTNKTAKQLALDGAPHATVVLAERQTAGRGRQGRSFFSPSCSGIYMSLLLKPNFDVHKSVLITTAASVAVSRAVQKVCGAEPRIKWVNDIYIDRKKVCGILTEAVTDIESGQVESIVLGIGINCQEPEGGFPEELKEIIGIVPNVTSKNALAAQVINEVMTLLPNIEAREFIEEYKLRSMVLNQEINVIKGGSSAAGIPAVALGIDDDGGLIVKYSGGKVETLNTGEISIRLK